MSIPEGHSREKLRCFNILAIRNVSDIPYHQSCRCFPGTSDGGYIRWLNTICKVVGFLRAKSPWIRYHVDLNFVFS